MRSLLGGLAGGAASGGDDARAKKALLQCLVEKVEIGNEKGKVWYTFPLEELTGFYSVPPREYDIKTRHVDELDFTPCFA